MLFKLIEEYDRRKNGEKPVSVKLDQDNAFLMYNEILNKLQVVLFPLIIIIGILSLSLINSVVLKFLIIVISLVILYVLRKDISNLKSFFQKEWAVDIGILKIIVGLDLLDDDEFSYVVENNLLKIVAYKNNPVSLNKMENLDKYLEAEFAAPLLDKKIEPEYVIYTLGEKKQISQMVYNSIDEVSVETFNQPLDIIKLSSSVSFSLKSSSMLGLYGRTGSGKTVALQWYLLSAIAKGVGTDRNSLLTIVDGKAADLFSLAELTQQELAGNVSIGSTPNALAKLSREFVEAMNERFEIIKKQGKLNADAYDLKLTPSFLFVDELASIRNTCTNTKQGKELWQEIVTNIGLVSKKGRQGGFHLVLSTQDPNAENIPSEIRNQISSVLYLSKPSTERLKMAFSMCDLEDVPDVPKQKGGALFYADGLNLNEPISVIAPFINLKTKKDFVDVINKIKPDPNNFI